MQESNEGYSITFGRLFPIKSLAIKIKGTKNRLTLALLWLSHSLLLLDPLPPPLHIGLITKVRFVYEQDGQLMLSPLGHDFGHDLVHPTFFSSEFGA